MDTGSKRYEKKYRDTGYERKKLYGYGIRKEKNIGIRDTKGKNYMDTGSKRYIGIFNVNFLRKISQLFN